MKIIVDDLNSVDNWKIGPFNFKQWMMQHDNDTLLVWFNDMDYLILGYRFWNHGCFVTMPTGESTIWRHTVIKINKFINLKNIVCAIKTTDHIRYNLYLVL